MKTHIKEIVQIPEGISCSIANSSIICKKGSAELSRSISIPLIEVSIKGNEIVIECKTGNKNQLKRIKSLRAHFKNIFNGLHSKYIYKLQACNVHFPMTLKVEKDRLLINNFLGEKNPRKAEILPNVNVEVKGTNVLVSSHDKEAAGQTAANIEKATKVKYRDRRIFQDGIYIVEKAVLEEAK
jgi:large subunit ribosomal protein L6